MTYQVLAFTKKAFYFEVDMKPFFTREIFEDKIQEVKRLGTYSYEVVDIADVIMIANKTIQKLIDASPVVYVKKHDYPGGFSFDIFGFQRDDSTHQAHLLFIEEIPKKECEHEPHTKFDHIDKGIHIECKHCGVELKAKWEPVK